MKHLILLSGAIVALASGTCSASTVAVGYDLFKTHAEHTTFGGIPFAGVPLNTFDFGGTSGVMNVGNTDTIVQRLDPAICPPGAPFTDTIDIELVALQLRSVSPVDFGAGLDFHFVTLSTSAPSLGNLEITFAGDNGGTSDSSIDVAFDLRIGGITGPIILSDTLTLTSLDSPWGRVPPPALLPPPDPLLIEGVNYHLNGVDDSEDHWRGVLPLTGEYAGIGCQPHGESGPSFPAIHCISPVPEPGTAALLGAGLAMLAFTRRRRWRSV